MKTVFILLIILLPQTTFARSNVTLVAFGDSIIGSAGVEKEYHFTTVLQEQYTKEGISITAINSGIEGLDTKKALNIIDEKILQYSPDIVLINLGTNDMYKQVEPSKIEYNLRMIIWTILNSKPNTKIVLIGALVLKGSDKYKEDFKNIFPRVASHYKIPLYPYLGKGFYGIPMFTINNSLHLTGFGLKSAMQEMTPYFDKYIRDQNTRSLTGNND